MTEGQISSSAATADQRKVALAQTVAAEVARGARVESQSDYQAILVRGKRPNHVLHLILTLITLGFWVVVWAALALLGGEKRTVWAVDDYANVIRR